MDDPDARYGIALPDNRRYRGLVERLPSLARRRLDLSVFFIRGTSETAHVDVLGPDTSTC